MRVLYAYGAAYKKSKHHYLHRVIFTENRVGFLFLGSRYFLASWDIGWPLGPAMQLRYPVTHKVPRKILPDAKPKQPMLYPVGASNKQERSMNMYVNDPAC